MLTIYAPNIHTGGGSRLLSLLVSSIDKFAPMSFVVDERMSLPLSQCSAIRVRRVNPTVIGRLCAEWELWRDGEQNDIVLSLNGLVPLFPLKAKIILFVQNRYLLGDGDLNEFPWLARWKIRLERLWFKFLRHRADQFVVQTPSMATSLREQFGVNPKLLALFEKTMVLPRKSDNEPTVSPASSFDFVYVAAGAPHKNHRRLLHAFAILAKDHGLTPSLCVTVSACGYPELSGWIDRFAGKERLNVTNLGEVSHVDILEMYGKCRALVFPSLFESFGLPLIEARQTGLPILAAERDYVRDILDPEQSFDPESVTSIARALRRFLEVDEDSLQVVDGRSFLNVILALR